MIEQTQTRAQRPALTSNLWHVVHSRWAPKVDSPPFIRSIASEHEHRAEAVDAAKLLIASLRDAGSERPVEEQDQVFVRRPHFKSLRFAHRRAPKRT